MAVYTEVAFADAAALVAGLGLGELTALQGIRSGIENTNYFVDTAAGGGRFETSAGGGRLETNAGGGRFVLTVFERLGPAELPFYLHLMKHLAERGLPVPGPKADAAGALLHTLHGKPAVVVDRLPGEHRLAPDAAQCAALGTVLARLHRAGRDFAMQQPNLRGLAWWAETVPVVRPFLAAEQRTLIDTELAFQQQLGASAAHAALPRGPIHADLFRDNVMFEGSGADERVSGLVDFYFAGIDTFAFDLAVVLNDWCTDLASGRLHEARAAALVAAYDRERSLTGAERRLLPALMRAAALRFWLSRLWDRHLPRDASLLQAHDPAHFERVLRERIAEPWHPGVPERGAEAADADAAAAAAADVATSAGPSSR